MEFLEHFDFNLFSHRLEVVTIFFQSNKITRVDWIEDVEVVKSGVESDEKNNPCQLSKSRILRKTIRQTRYVSSLENNNQSIIMSIAVMSTLFTQPPCNRIKSTASGRKKQNNKIHVKFTNEVSSRVQSEKLFPEDLNKITASKKMLSFEATVKAKRFRSLAINAFQLLGPDSKVY